MQFIWPKNKKQDSFSDLILIKYSMKKTYEPPVMEVWRIDLQRSADLLVSLSLQGNVSDFEPGDDEDLTVDDWGA